MDVSSFLTLIVFKYQKLKWQENKKIYLFNSSFAFRMLLCYLYKPRSKRQVRTLFYRKNQMFCLVCTLKYHHLLSWYGWRCVSCMALLDGLPWNLVQAFKPPSSTIIRFRSTCKTDAIQCQLENIIMRKNFSPAKHQHVYCECEERQAWKKIVASGQAVELPPPGRLHDVKGPKNSLSHRLKLGKRHL